MASNKTHHASGIAAGLLAAAIVVKAGAGGAYYVLAMITWLAGSLGGTAPDWLEVAWWRRKKKRGAQRLWITHRTLTHWGIAWVALLYFSHKNLGSVWWACAVFGFAAGGLMHLLTDWPNPLGVPWIFRRHSLGLWRSGHLEWMVTLLSWGLCAVLADALIFDSVYAVRFIRFVPQFLASQCYILKM
jgi:membrane-bound metal-dependent hydrolase YbcI (DUF457 family)